MGCNLRDLATPHPVELSDFNGQRVAVDAFLLAYQFITSLRKRGEGADGSPLTDSNGHPVSHLMGFLDRATLMIESGIDPIFVFDGRPHELKMQTLANRKSRKDDAQEKWDRAVADEDWTTAQKLGSQIVSYTREMVAETRAMLGEKIIWESEKHCFVFSWLVTRSCKLVITDRCISIVFRCTV